MLILLALAAVILLPEPWGLVALVAALAIEALELVLWKRFLRRYRLRSGPETLIGAYATVVGECALEGRVRVRGELWRARPSFAAAVGERVRITAIDGLTLRVEPESEPHLATEKGP